MNPDKSIYREIEFYSTYKNLAIFIRSEMKIKGAYCGNVSNLKAFEKNRAKRV